jgi:branched-chain amino acid transport system substrate-binding protein
MKKGLIVLVAVFCVATLGFAQAGSAVKQWNIPFLDCLTGAIASIGEYLAWGAQRAAFEINAAGGIAGKPVNITAIDTALDPQKGSVAMAMVVESSLVAIGPVPEPVILAAMPIAVEAKMMSMTATTSYEYAVKFFPWTVSFLPPTEKRLGVVITSWAQLHPGMKKVVQFLENYGAWPGMADAHTKALTALNIATQNVDVPTDSVAFGPLVVKALDAKPDGIIFSCNPNKIGLMIKELKSRGWTNMGQILVFSSGDAPELYTTGGTDINGVNIYNYIDPNSTTPRFKAFSEAYSKDHGGTPAPSLSTKYYDAVYMIKEAIEKTGVTGDPKKLAAERKLIADYCANVQSFHGIMYDWSMKDGVPTNMPAYIFEIQGGQKKLLKEIR